MQARTALNEYIFRRHDPRSWPGFDHRRAAPRSYGRFEQLYSNTAREALSPLVRFQAVDPGNGSTPRSLSPSNIDLVPAGLFPLLPRLVTPVVDLRPQRLNVSHAEAVALQLMHAGIWAARSAMPYSSNLLSGLSDSSFYAAEAITAMRQITIAEIAQVCNELPRECKQPGNAERHTDLALLTDAASFHAGNSAELSRFGFYLLGSLPDMQPYKMEVLRSPSLDHYLLVVHAGGKHPLVADAWCQCPMAARADQILPDYRASFFPGRLSRHKPDVILSKRAGEMLPPFPSRHIAAVHEQGKGIDLLQTLLEQGSGSPDAFALAKLTEMATRPDPRLRSLIYTSPPGTEYVVEPRRHMRLGQGSGATPPMNLKYRFEPVNPL